MMRRRQSLRLLSVLKGRENRWFRVREQGGLVLLVEFSVRDSEIGSSTWQKSRGMKVEEFKAVMKRLEQLYLAAGVTAPAKDLQSIARLLDGYEGKLLDEFIAETIAVLAGPSQPEK